MNSLTNSGISTVSDTTQGIPSTTVSGHRIDVVTRDPAYRVRHREEYFGGSQQD